MGVGLFLRRMIHGIWIIVENEIEGADNPQTDPETCTTSAEGG